MTAADKLLTRFEAALDKFHSVYADPYADAEDKGDAKRAVRDARDAVLQALGPWNHVGRNGPPPCDGRTVYTGINTAGFACCFNEVTQDGVCSMAGAEIYTVQMSGLEWWRLLDRPTEAAAAPASTFSEA